jgi:hypothetical protein
MSGPFTQRCATCRFCGEGKKIRQDGSIGRQLLLCLRYPRGLGHSREIFAQEWCGEYSRSVARTIRPFSDVLHEAKRCDEKGGA